MNDENEGGDRENNEEETVENANVENVNVENEVENEVAGEGLSNEDESVENVNVEKEMAVKKTSTSKRYEEKLKELKIFTPTLRRVIDNIDPNVNMEVQNACREKLKIVYKMIEGPKKERPSMKYEGLLKLEGILKTIASRMIKGKKREGSPSQRSLTVEEELSQPSTSQQLPGPSGMSFNQTDNNNDEQHPSTSIYLPGPSGMSFKQTDNNNDEQHPSTSKHLPGPSGLSFEQTDNNNDEQHPATTKTSNDKAVAFKIKPVRPKLPNVNVATMKKFKNATNSIGKDKSNKKSDKVPESSSTASSSRTPIYMPEPLFTPDKKVSKVNPGTSHGGGPRNSGRYSESGSYRPRFSGKDTLPAHSFSSRGGRYRAPFSHSDERQRPSYSHGSDRSRHPQTGERFRHPQSGDRFRHPQSGERFRYPHKEERYRHSHSGDRFRFENSQERLRFENSEERLRFENSEERLRYENSEERLRPPYSEETSRHLYREEMFRHTDSEETFRNPYSAETSRHPHREEMFRHTDSEETFRNPYSADRSRPPFSSRGDRYRPPFSRREERYSPPFSNREERYSPPFSSREERYSPPHYGSRDRSEPFFTDIEERYYDKPKSETRHREKYEEHYIEPLRGKPFDESTIASTFSDIDIESSWDSSSILGSFGNVEMHQKDLEKLNQSTQQLKSRLNNRLKNMKAQQRLLLASTNRDSDTSCKDSIENNTSKDLKGNMEIALPFPDSSIVPNPFIDNIMSTLTSRIPLKRDFIITNDQGRSKNKQKIEDFCKSDAPELKGIEIVDTSYLGTSCTNKLPFLTDKDIAEVKSDIKRLMQEKLNSTPTSTVTSSTQKQISLPAVSDNSFKIPAVNLVQEKRTEFHITPNRPNNDFDLHIPGLDGIILPYSEKHSVSSEESVLNKTKDHSLVTKGLKSLVIQSSQENCKKLNVSKCETIQSDKVIDSRIKLNSNENVDEIKPIRNCNPSQNIDFNKTKPTQSLRSKLTGEISTLHKVGTPCGGALRGLVKRDKMMPSGQIASLKPGALYDLMSEEKPARSATKTKVRPQLQQNFSSHPNSNFNLSVVCPNEGESSSSAVKVKNPDDIISKLSEHDLKKIITENIETLPSPPHLSFLNNSVPNHINSDVSINLNSPSRGFSWNNQNSSMQQINLNAQKDTTINTNVPSVENTNNNSLTIQQSGLNWGKSEINDKWKINKHNKDPRRESQNIATDVPLANHQSIYSTSSEQFKSREREISMESFYSNRFNAPIVLQTDPLRSPCYDGSTTPDPYRPDPYTMNLKCSFEKRGQVCNDSTEQLQDYPRPPVGDTPLKFDTYIQIQPEAPTNFRREVPQRPPLLRTPPLQAQGHPLMGTQTYFPDQQLCYNDPRNTWGAANTYAEWKAEKNKTEGRNFNNFQSCDTNYHNDRISDSRRHFNKYKWTSENYDQWSRDGNVQYMTDVGRSRPKDSESVKKLSARDPRRKSLDDNLERKDGLPFSSTDIKNPEFCSRKSLPTEKHSYEKPCRRDPRRRERTPPRRRSASRDQSHYGPRDRSLSRGRQRSPSRGRSPSRRSDDNKLSRIEKDKDTYSSPLDQLYTSTSVPKTGLGYGFQRFRIPKRNKGSNDHPTKPQIKEIHCQKDSSEDYKKCKNSERELKDKKDNENLHKTFEEDSALRNDRREENNLNKKDIEIREISNGGGDNCSLDLQSLVKQTDDKVKVKVEEIKCNLESRSSETSLHSEDECAGEELKPSPCRRSKRLITKKKGRPPTSISKKKLQNCDSNSDTNHEAQLNDKVEIGSTDFAKSDSDTNQEAQLNDKVEIGSTDFAKICIQSELKGNDVDLKSKRVVVEENNKTEFLGEENDKGKNQSSPASNVICPNIKIQSLESYGSNRNVPISESSCAVKELLPESVVNNNKEILDTIPLASDHTSSQEMLQLVKQNNMSSIKVPQNRDGVYQKLENTGQKDEDTLCSTKITGSENLQSTSNPLDLVDTCPEIKIIKHVERIEDVIGIKLTPDKIRKMAEILYVTDANEMIGEQPVENKVGESTGAIQELVSEVKSDDVTNEADKLIMSSEFKKETCSDKKTLLEIKDEKEIEKLSDIDDGRESFKSNKTKVIKKTKSNRSKDQIPKNEDPGTENTTKKQKRKYKNELDRLQDDISKYHDSEAIAAASGPRQCRLQKEKSQSTGPLPHANKPILNTKKTRKSKDYEYYDSEDASSICKDDTNELDESEDVSCKEESDEEIKEDTGDEKIENKYSESDSTDDDPFHVYSEKMKSKYGFLLEEEKKVVKSSNDINTRSPKGNNEAEFKSLSVITKDHDSQKPVPNKDNCSQDKSVKEKSSPSSQTDSGDKPENVEFKCSNEIDAKLGGPTTHEFTTPEQVIENLTDKESDFGIEAKIEKPKDNIFHNCGLKKQRKKKFWSAGIIRKKTKSKKTDSPVLSQNNDDNDTFPIEEDEDVIVNQVPDLNYFQEGESKLTKCKLCSFHGKSIVSHYAITHPKDEVLISRMSSKAAEIALKESAQFFSLSDEKKKNYAATFECRICFLKTNKFSIFFEHMALHTGEFRHECCKCGYRTSTRSGILRHYQNHNVKNTNNKSCRIVYKEPSDKTCFCGYLCSLCNYFQISQNNVKRHVENIHEIQNFNDVIKINFSKLTISESDLAHSTDIGSVNAVSSMTKTTSFEMIQKEKSSTNEIDTVEKEQVISGIQLPDVLRAYESCNVTVDLGSQESLKINNKDSKSNSGGISGLLLKPNEAEGVNNCVSSVDNSATSDSQVLTNNMEELTDKQKTLISHDVAYIVEDEKESHFQNKEVNTKEEASLECSVASSKETEILTLNNNTEDTADIKESLNVSSLMKDARMDIEENCNVCIDAPASKDKVDIDAPLSKDIVDLNLNKEAPTSSDKEQNCHECVDVSSAKETNIQDLEKGVAPMLIHNDWFLCLCENVNEINRHHLIETANASVLSRVENMNVKANSSNIVDEVGRRYVSVIEDALPLNHLFEVPVFLRVNKKAKLTIDESTEGLSQEKVVENDEGEATPARRLLPDRTCKGGFSKQTTDRERDGEVNSEEDDDIETYQIVKDTGHYESNWDDDVIVGEEFVPEIAKTAVENSQVLPCLRAPVQFYLRKIASRKPLSIQDKPYISSLPLNSNLSEFTHVMKQIAQVSLKVSEIKEVQVGGLKAIPADYGIMFSCSVKVFNKECCFQTSDLELFGQHVNVAHHTFYWNGVCCACLVHFVKDPDSHDKVSVNTQSKAFCHLVREHLTFTKKATKAAARGNSNVKQVVKSDETPPPRLRVRRLSGDKLSGTADENQLTLPTRIIVSGASEVKNADPLLAPLYQGNSSHIDPNEFSQLFDLEAHRNPPLPNFIRGVKVFRPFKNSKEGKCTFKALRFYIDMCLHHKLRQLYKCMGAKCSYSTISMKEFAKHLNEHNETYLLKPDEDPHRGFFNVCAYCLTPYGTTKELCIHIRKEHAVCTMQCSRCFYRAKSIANVHFHHTMEHSRERFSVLLCDQMESNLPPFVEKPFTEYVSAFRCSLRESCSLFTYMLDTFCNHLKLAHPHDLRCHLCMEPYTNIKGLLQHYCEKHGIALFQCLFCTYGAATEQEIRQHLCYVHPNTEPKALQRTDNNAKLPQNIGTNKESIKRLMFYKDQEKLMPFIKSPDFEEQDAQFELELKDPLSVDVEMNTDRTHFEPTSFPPSSQEMNLFAGEPTVRSTLQQTAPTIFPSNMPRFNRPAILRKRPAPEIYNPFKIRILSPSKPSSEGIKMIPTPVSPSKGNLPARLSFSLAVPSTVQTSQNKNFSKSPDSGYSGSETARSLLTTESDITFATFKIERDNPATDDDPTIIEKDPLSTDGYNFPKKDPLSTDGDSLSQKDPLSTDWDSLPQKDSLSTDWDSLPQKDSLSTDGDSLPPPSTLPNIPNTSENTSSIGEAVDVNYFKCGNKGCTFETSTSAPLRSHLVICDQARQSQKMSCTFCHREFKQVGSYVEHLRIHGPERYSCSLCPFKASLLTRVNSHMKACHNVFTTVAIPVVNSKQDSEKDYFTVSCRDKRREKAGPKGKAKSEIKTMFSAEELDDVPKSAIFLNALGCRLCSYQTKVRSNLVRHIKLHTSGDPVAREEVVNPVPEKTEKMFDKMMNLAGSSHKKKSGQENPSDGAACMYKYVPDQDRYRCHVKECGYRTLGETMLRDHISVIHKEETHYTCPHCTEEIDVLPIPVDQMSMHLKLHDSPVFKCAYCVYCSHVRRSIERHIEVLHPGEPVDVQALRLTKPDLNVEQPAFKIRSTDKLDEQGENWFCCNHCVFKSKKKKLMQQHGVLEHKTSKPFKCSTCGYVGKTEQILKDHFNTSHPEEDCTIIALYRKVTELKKPILPPIPPLWKRDAKRLKLIRGIKLDEKGDAPPPVATATTGIEGLDVLELKFGHFGKPFGTNYMCPRCSTSFVTKGRQEMKEHLYKDLEYSPILCKICKTGSTQRTKVMKHISKHHSIDWDQISELIEINANEELESWVEKVLSRQQSLMVMNESPSTSAEGAAESRKRRRSSVEASPHESPESPSTSLSRNVEVSESESHLSDQGSNATTVSGERDGPIVREKRKRDKCTSRHRFACEYCEITTKYKHSITLHCKKFHPDLPPKVKTLAKTIDDKAEAYDCMYCNCTSLSLNNLKHHWIYTHKNSGLNFLFRNTTFNTEHEYECYWCNSRSDLETLEEHCKDKHAAQRFLVLSISVPKYKCSECSLVFKSVDTLKRHFGVAHQSKKFCYIVVNTQRPASSSDRTSPSSSSLPESSPQPKSITYKCFDCNYVSSRFWPLVKHMQTHFLSYMCTECESLFPSVSGLNSHMLSDHALSSAKPHILKGTEMDIENAQKKIIVVSESGRERKITEEELAEAKKEINSEEENIEMYRYDEPLVVQMSPPTIRETARKSTGSPKNHSTLHRLPTSQLLQQIQKSPMRKPLFKVKRKRFCLNNTFVTVRSHDRVISLPAETFSKLINFNGEPMLKTNVI